jgi:hypothetical protein
MVLPSVRRPPRRSDAGQRGRCLRNPPKQACVASCTLTPSKFKAEPPPSLAEVIARRKGMNELLSRCMVSWTAEGFNRIHVMGEAEKRYQAMGLL